MSFRDDEDELFLSPSSQDAFQSREQAKEKAKKQKAKQKGKLLSLKRMLLRGQVEEEETKSEEKVPETFGTKTRMQIEESSLLDANKNRTTDDMVEESHREEKRKEDQEEERAHEDV